MRNVLVVEDSPLVLKILEHLFRQEPDLQPLFCASLGEAQVLLEASSALFFAAIVDLNLPDAPHGEIVDLVLQYSVPCIVLSGSYDEHRRDELLLGYEASNEWPGYADDVVDLDVVEVDQPYMPDPSADATDLEL